MLDDAGSDPAEVVGQFDNVHAGIRVPFHPTHEDSFTLKRMNGIT